MAGSSECCLVEGPGTPGNYGGGECGYDPLPARKLQGRNHGKRHYGDGEYQCYEEAALHHCGSAGLSVGALG